MCQYSFVVPVYNINESFLRKCIDSILSDRTEKLELILVDDHSTNGCELICDEYAEKDNRVRVVHHKNNMGVSSARNTGVATSRGEWIIFVDADDWIEKNSCEILSSVISKDIDIVVFSAFRDSKNGSYPFGVPTGVEYFARTDEQVDNEHSMKELSDKLLKQSLISTHPMYDTLKYCWGKAFRRDFLESAKIRFPQINYCEDIVYMATILQKSKRVVMIPERLYHYRLSATSTVNSYRESALSEQRVFLRLLSEVLDEGDNNLYYATLLSMEICIARYFFNKERKASIFKKHLEARKAFSKSPFDEVFQHINIAKMKKKEKIKAILIRLRLYSLYYLGTTVKRAYL